MSKQKNFVESDNDSEILNECTSDSYLMIRNIGYLFGYMGDFSCNKEKNFFELWEKKRL